MGTVEPGRMLPMHLVKLGAWDPNGCVWVRKSSEGDVLHRQKAGYPVPTASRMGIKLGGRPELHRQSSFMVHFINQRILKVIFCPDFIGYLAISGSLWIKATAPSPPRHSYSECPNQSAILSHSGRSHKICFLAYVHSALLSRGTWCARYHVVINRNDQQ